MYVISSGSRQTRVLLVDDKDFIREALRRILEPDFEVVGEACDAREAIRCCQDLHPDIVVLDISLPDRSGFRVIEDIFRCCPRARTIFVSAHSSEEYVREAFRRGACGYVLKRNAVSELRTAINIAIGGGTIERSARPLSSNGHLGAQLAIDPLEASKPVLTAMHPDELMSEQSLAPGPLCTLGQRLLTDFAEAVELVVKILQDQLSAVKSGDLAANRFDLLIHEANERKQNAKYSYLHHLQTHRCDAGDGIEHSRS